MNGVICANFGCWDNMGSMWKGAWHGLCFQQGFLDRSPVLLLKFLEKLLVDNSTMIDEDHTFSKKEKTVIT